MAFPKRPSPLKIAANRRNALKSTGPKTAAGKRRVALNTRSRDLVPEELERQLLARGEGPAGFPPPAPRFDRHLPPRRPCGTGRRASHSAEVVGEGAPDAQLGGLRPGGDRRLEQATGGVDPVPGLHPAAAARVVAASAGRRAGAGGGSGGCATEDRGTPLHFWCQAGQTEVPTANPEGANVRGIHRGGRADAGRGGREDARESDQRDVETPRRSGRTRQRGSGFGVRSSQRRVGVRGSGLGTRSRNTMRCGRSIASGGFFLREPRTPNPEPPTNRAKQTQRINAFIVNYIG